MCSLLLLFVFALTQKEPKKSRIINSLRSNTIIRLSHVDASWDFNNLALQMLKLFNLFHFLKKPTFRSRLNIILLKSMVKIHKFRFSLYHTKTTTQLN